MTVDRKNRDLLIAAINRYLDGETTAFKFDDEIFGIKSDDPTISYAVRQLWYFYDDLKDHKVRLSKEGWDYIQRLIPSFNPTPRSKSEGGGGGILRS